VIPRAVASACRRGSGRKPTAACAAYRSPGCHYRRLVEGRSQTVQCRRGCRGGPHLHAVEAGASPAHQEDVVGRHRQMGMRCKLQQMRHLSSALLQKSEGRRRGKTESKRHTGCGCWTIGICSGDASMHGQTRHFWCRASLPRKPFTAHGKKYQDYVTMSVPKDADSNFRNKNSSYLLFLGVKCHI